MYAFTQLAVVPRGHFSLTPSVCHVEARKSARAPSVGAVSRQPRKLTVPRMAFDWKDPEQLLGALALFQAIGVTVGVVIVTIDSLIKKNNLRVSRQQLQQSRVEEKVKKELKKLLKKSSSGLPRSTKKVQRARGFEEGSKSDETD
ncbi:hypothetical protein FVE85_4150 [Porphyridium purpureum]|uniref:Uncharacterized protein n=1 Tax=Porphyridium purpureum TaxID=35688 RepID=A0A5J4YSG4_PORPP|nr:hypothetical protein FVE85_4150 [Porphyridium purpureum]|eukprot:POR0197..scf229_5